MTADTLLTDAADALDDYAKTIYVNEQAEPSPFDFLIAAFKAKRQKYVDLAHQLREREEKAEGLDAARLDWIERELPQSITEGDERGKWEVWTRTGHLVYGKTVRKAIDAAILATKPGDGESRE